MHARRRRGTNNLLFVCNIVVYVSLYPCYTIEYGTVLYTAVVSDVIRILAVLLFWGLGHPVLCSVYALHAPVMSTCAGVLISSFGARLTFRFPVKSGSEISKNRPF